MAPKLVNLALLGLFPLAWLAPLVSTEVAWLFTVEDISVLSGIRQLYDVDPILAGIVGFFAIVAPYLKSLALVYAQFSPREDARRILPALEVLGRLSMVDVFLIALTVLVYRGVGEVKVEWGFYFFAGLVLASIWAGWATKRQRFRTVLAEDAEALKRMAETPSGGTSGPPGDNPSAPLDDGAVKRFAETPGASQVSKMFDPAVAGARREHG